MGGSIMVDQTILSAKGNAKNALLGTLAASGQADTWEDQGWQKFVKAYQDAYGGRSPDIYSTGGWDGMHLIYETLKKTGGKADGDSLIAAAKGMRWESPRGPISIDPETRDIVQTIYIRRVEKVGGQLRNVEIEKIENVKDPVKARMKN